LLKQFNESTADLARLVLNGPRSLSIEEHRTRVHELEERKERLEDEISRVSAEFRAHSQPVTLSAVRAAIPPKTALIEFAVYRPFDPRAENNDEAYGKPRYIAYVLHDKGEARWRDLGDARAIDQSIGSLRQALRDPQRRDVRELARAVDERVMQPVRELIDDSTQLLVSPDGALNLIPFEALVDERGRYLIERYSITYLTSGRDLLRLQVPRAAAETSLVIADPSYGEPELSQTTETDKTGSADRPKRPGGTDSSDLSDIYFTPLTGTAQEARAIKSLFPDITTLLGPQATESSLKQASAPRILHIATHGFFLTDGARTPDLQATRSISGTAKVENPLLRAGLALAGANRRSNTGDDGILTALEASGLNLWGTKLVVLSACDTGVGEVKNGEGVYGLRRAFVLAGTETLVMSLWPVSDYVTRELMATYYCGLKQGGGRGEALRQVKLRMLKSAAREHPFYWAGFVQSGEWASLDGKR
ncbi:MAG TPA: CHAT domain-containing protein, partial [Blastocatellia bacterium]|nr:CHAT domain-containing protein [Blastocatellia bacterium]